jgi:hypothetical protein
MTGGRTLNEVSKRSGIQLLRQLTIQFRLKAHDFKQFWVGCSSKNAIVLLGAFPERRRSSAGRAADS